MKNKKIALFMLPLLTQGGGAEKYFIEVARNLNEKGIEADIVTMDEIFFRKFARLLHIFVLGNFFGKIDTGGRESEKAILEKLGDSRWKKTSYKELGKLLKEYGLIYAKNEIADLALLKSVGYKKMPPIIIGVHTPIYYPKTKSLISKLHNYLYASFIYKWLLGGVRCIHVSNRATEEIIKRKYKNIERKLVYYPFSAKKFAESALKYRDEFKFDSNKKNIIFIGRLGEQKGVETLENIIEKIGKIEGLTDEIHINIFGSGDEKCGKTIEMLSEKYHFVRYFIHVEHKYIPHILSQQDLMIAPYQWETLPYAILEAQAMGLPVVAFDIPGPADIIENGKTGFLVRDKKEFIKAIELIVKEGIIFDRKIIVKNIEKKFDPNKIYPKLINMFENYL